MSASKQQEGLVGCLAGRNAKLARIYKTSLLVLFDEDNPSRFELAAHCMRELIRNSPLLINAERLVTGDTMKSRLDEIRRTYRTLTQGQGFADDSSLSGLEAQVRAVIVAISRYLKWESDYRPQARKRTAATLSGLSGPGQALPVDISGDEVAGWMRADEYFKMVAHYSNETVDQNEFVRHMTLIEAVLLRRLQPPAVSELDALDALITEGEDGYR
jgi:hypothetical protein